MDLLIGPLGPVAMRLWSAPRAILGRRSVDERRKCLVLHTQTIGTRNLGCMIEEEGCLQRAVHNQPGVALGVAGIGQIVVDAVAVERDR